jgi:hypothetical protein
MRIADRTAAFLAPQLSDPWLQRAIDVQLQCPAAAAASKVGDWSVVSTAWMESMTGRTSESSAINPNAAGSNIVRGLTEPDTALRRSKDNDAALRVPREMGCSSVSTSARSARVDLEVLSSWAPVPQWINEAPSRSDAETILPPIALV